ncbi:MAG: PilZ domain-containing protein [Ancalomicrobiaceae bacterium]|nr:PilZ domain-containing protein [Ancalomicrobiaceae bacterium]
MTIESERRRTPRRRLLKSAKIVFNHKASVVDCLVRSRNDTGFGLKLEGVAPIPDEFLLMIDGEQIPVAKIWQHGLNVGVAIV